jgi:hypothetical protein
MKISTQRLIDIINEAGFEPRPYSGRGMHGTKCVGIDTDDGLLRTMAELVGECEDTQEARNLIMEVHSDSMGLGAIMYWPGAKLAGDEQGLDYEQDL